MFYICEMTWGAFGLITKVFGLMLMKKVLTICTYTGFDGYTIRRAGAMTVL